MLLWLYDLIVAVECIHTVIFVLKCGKAQHWVAKIWVIKNMDGRHLHSSTISMHKRYVECQMWCLLPILHYDEIEGKF